MLLMGTVADGGYGVAGEYLTGVLALIEERSKLRPLIPNTLNITLDAEYQVMPDFVVSAAEYNGSEELRFKHCSIGGIRCVIMRPDTHEAGQFHGRAYLELMSTVWLRETLSLTPRDRVEVLV